MNCDQIILHLTDKATFLFKLHYQIEIISNDLSHSLTDVWTLMVKSQWIT